MRLGQVPPSFILRLWLLGLALELGLLGLGALWFERRRHLTDLRLRALAHPESLTTDERAAVAPFFRDTLRMEFVSQDGKVTLRDLEPKRDRILFLRAAPGEPGTAVLRAIVYLPLPILLSAVTVLWWYARSRKSAGEPPGPVPD